jgi:GGDEF domain-containing protein
MSQGHKCDNSVLCEACLSVLTICKNRSSYSSSHMSRCYKYGGDYFVLSGGMYQGFVHIDQ